MDEEDFLDTVLRRRRSGYLKRIKENFRTQKFIYQVLPLIDPITKGLFKYPILNGECEYNCVVDGENIQDYISISSDKNEFKCPVCEKKIDTNKYFYEVDVANYLFQFADQIKQYKCIDEIQLQMDEKDRIFLAKKKETSQMPTCKNPVETIDSQDQSQISNLQNYTDRVKKIFDTAKVNIARYTMLYGGSLKNVSKINNMSGSTKLNMVSWQEFIKNVAISLQRNVEIKTNSKTSEKFTFWINKLKGDLVISLYYPLLNTWYKAELDKSHNISFSDLETYICLAAQNGNIYLLGGLDKANKKITKAVYEINVSLKEESKNGQVHVFKIKQKNNMPDERLYSAYCELNNRIYLIGGYYTDNSNRILEDKLRSSSLVYDIQQDKWEDLEGPNHLRGFASAFATKSQKIYLFGGLTYTKKSGGRDIKHIKNVEEYDIASDRWRVMSEISDLILQSQKIRFKQCLGMFSPDDETLILFGGKIFEANLGSSQYEDPNLSSSCSTIKYNIKTSVINSGSQLPKVYYSANRTSNVFSNIMAFPYNYALFGNKVYIYLPYFDANALENVESCLIYDMEVDQWQIVIKKEEPTQKKSSIKFMDL